MKLKGENILKEAEPDFTDMKLLRSWSPVL